MDLKTKLGEDIIFGKMERGKQVVTTLNKKGIFTVEDFINSDIDQIASHGNLRKNYRAYQEILKYIYLGVPLTMDVLLEKECSMGNELNKHMSRLGFAGYGAPIWESIIARISFKNGGKCRYIDLIKELSSKFEYLTDFYIEYYNTQLNKQNVEETPVESDKKSLDTLKNELIGLLNQRNALDTKIASLLEQINALEGGKTNNARK